MIRNLLVCSTRQDPAGAWGAGGGGVVMDEPLCILWPDNDGLFLQDIRPNDLGPAAARPLLLALRSTSFSGRVWECHPDDLITSTSRCSSSPLPWPFQHQRGYSSSVTWCSGLRERTSGGIKQPLSCCFLSSNLKFLFYTHAAKTKVPLATSDLFLWVINAVSHIGHFFFFRRRHSL